MSDGQPDDADRQDYRQVFDRLAVFLRDKRFAEGAEYLRSYIARQRDPMARFEPMGDLAVVLEVNGELSESLAVMRERTELAPDEPIGWCALANWHVCHGADGTVNKPDGERALQVIDHAIAVAERTGGAWLRHCLNDRARIAKRVGNWSVLEDTIRRILAIPDGRNVPDTAIEVDFLRHIPPGAVDPDLVERLLAKHAAAMARRNARQD